MQHTGGLQSAGGLSALASLPPAAPSARPLQLLASESELLSSRMGSAAGAAADCSAVGVRGGLPRPRFGLPLAGALTAAPLPLAAELPALRVRLRFAGFAAAGFAAAPAPAAVRPASPGGPTGGALPTSGLAPQATRVPLAKTCLPSWRAPRRRRHLPWRPCPACRAASPPWLGWRLQRIAPLPRPQPLLWTPWAGGPAASPPLAAAPSSAACL